MSLNIQVRPRYNDRAVHTRLYVFLKDESLIDNINNRRRRPIAAWRKIAIEALAEAGINYSELRWSQYAGCSCPCSPGFIVKGDKWRDVFVTVESEVAA